MSILDGESRDLGEVLAQALEDGRITRRQLVKRGMAAGLSLSAISTILAACGGGGGGAVVAPETTPTLSSEPVTLRLIWLDWPPARLLEEFANENYKKLRPNVTVKVDVLPQTQWHDGIFTQFAANKTSFDMPILDSQFIGEAVTNDDLVDLTDWANKNIDTTAYASNLLAAYGVYPQAPDGKYKQGDPLYGLPVLSDCIALCWRKDLVGDSPPPTFDDMIAAAKEFQDANEGSYGLAFQQANAYDVAANIFNMVLWIYGGELWDPEKQQIEGILNNETGHKAMHILVDQMVPLAPPGSATWTFAETNAAMNQGNVAIATNWLATFGQLLDPKESRVADTTEGILAKLGFAPLPKQVTDSVVLGGMGLHISAYSSNVDESLNFIKWFEESATQMAWAAAGGVPARNDALQSPQFLDQAPYNQAFVDSVPRLKDFWSVPQFAKMVDVQSTLVNAAITGTKDPDAAIDEIAKQQQAILDG